MSVYVSAYVWRHSQAKGGTRLVLLALADAADDDGLIPPHRAVSIERLVKKTLLGARNVRYCLRELEGQDTPDRKGINPPELAVQPGTGRETSRYQILMRQLPMFGPDHDLPAEVEKAVDKPAENSSQVSSEPGSVLPPREAKPPREGGSVLPPEARIDVVDVKASPGGPAPRVVEKPKINGHTYSPSPAVIAWAAEHAYLPFLPLHIDYFRDYLANRKKPSYPDPDAAFRQCVRADWGGVRGKAQRAARAGQGPDLERWWKSPDGFKAKGLALGLQYDPKKYSNFIDYEITIIDAAIEKDGWGGGWADPRNAQYSYVLERRKRRGADIPEEIDA